MAMSGVCESCGKKTTNVLMSIRGLQMICNDCAAGQMRVIARPEHVLRYQIRRAAYAQSRTAR